MVEPQPLDAAWLRGHPLPAPDPDSDKNTRGQVALIGGSAIVPGGLLLTAEAALRAGAGKVQAATIRSAALAMGMAMPELAVFALHESADGEIANLDGFPHKCLDRCDALVAGPAMGSAEAAGRVVDRLLDDPRDGVTLILDAAALMSLGDRRTAMAARHAPAVLTPHIGEMAAMLDCAADAVNADRAAAARRAADRFGAVVALKGSTTLIAEPGGTLFRYAGGDIGLATSGSGDVLAGIAAGLAARGASPLDALLWAVWLHGEAGRCAANDFGPIGFLARDVLRHIPALMRPA